MCVVHKLLQMEPNMHSTETTTVTTHTAAAAPTARVGRRPRPQPKGFIIEVLMQVERTDPMIARHLGCSHVGYMQKVFKRKCDAAKYYNHHNSHMRSLNAHVKSEKKISTHKRNRLFPYMEMYSKKCIFS